MGHTTFTHFAEQMTKRVTCGNCKSDFTISTEPGIDTEKFTRMFYEKARTTSWSRGERVLFIGSQDCPLCSSTEIPERVKKQLIKMFREEKVRSHNGLPSHTHTMRGLTSLKFTHGGDNDKVCVPSISPGSALRPSSTRTIINATQERSRNEWPSLSSTPSSASAATASAPTKSFAEMAKSEGRSATEGEQTKKLIVQVPCRYCKNPTDTTLLKNGLCSKCSDRFSCTQRGAPSTSVAHSNNSNRVFAPDEGCGDEEVDEDDYDAPEDADIACDTAHEYD